MDNYFSTLCEFTKITSNILIYFLIISLIRLPFTSNLNYNIAMIDLLRSSYDPNLLYLKFYQD